MRLLHGSKSGEFRYPLQPAPKVAVFSSLFRRAGNLRLFPETDLPDLSKLKTQTIAAPVTLLRQLANPGWIQQYPLIAFTGCRFGHLAEADRSLFWERFGVPVFEQLCGPEGHVLAEECEAHEGLHIDDGAVLAELQATSPGGIIEQKLCGCGKSGRRLVRSGEPLQSALPAVRS